VDVRGEILELKNTINTMVDQLNAFAGEVTRVARDDGACYLGPLPSTSAAHLVREAIEDRLKLMRATKAQMSADLRPLQRLPPRTGQSGLQESWPPRIYRHPQRRQERSVDRSRHRHRKATD